MSPEMGMLFVTVEVICANISDERILLRISWANSSIGVSVTEINVIGSIITSNGAIIRYWPPMAAPPTMVPRPSIRAAERIIITAGLNESKSTMVDVPSDGGVVTLSVQVDASVVA